MPGQPRPFETQGMAFVPILPGEFLMGSPKSDPYVREDETPQHRVTLSRGFYLGTYPVTQEQYCRVTGRNIADHKDPGCPVESVSRFTAIEFCRRFSDLAGDEVTLPTEAQWEYACRAGTQGRYYWGDDPAELDHYAWHRGNSGNQIHPVGGKRPNAWGLYDMLGNVWEWCLDGYQANYYARSPSTDPAGPPDMVQAVVRGGSFLNDASRTGCASRGVTYPEIGRNRYGLRLCMPFRV